MRAGRDSSTPLLASITLATSFASAANAESLLSPGLVKIAGADTEITTDVAAETLQFSSPGGVVILAMHKTEQARQITIVQDLDPPVGETDWAWGTADSNGEHVTGLGRVTVRRVSAQPVEATIALDDALFAQATMEVDLLRDGLPVASYVVAGAPGAAPSTTIVLAPAPAPMRGASEAGVIVEQLAASVRTVRSFDVDLNMTAPGLAPVVADAIAFDVAAPAGLALANLSLRASLESGAAGPATLTLRGEVLSPSCSSDLNGDGATDATDLAELLGGWGPCP
ncbi:MAG: hypothetical protein GF393_09345 [Armatimonadia bacterium]|nr:hypothetical protein [Armatimonadia bacterium]